MFKTLSALLKRGELATLAGITFKGQRDLYKHLGYKRDLQFFDYDNRYERGGIASRIVTAYPNATWRTNPVVSDGDIQNPTPFMIAWEELVTKFKVWHYLQRLDKIAGIGRYATLYLGVADGKNVNSSIGTLKGLKDLLFISIFKEGSSDINRFETNMNNARFGLPLEYNLKTESKSGDKNIHSINPVHYSRIIHVADDTDENDLFGIPRMKKTWNYLDDLDKISGGTGEAIWQTIVPAIQFDIEKDATLNPEDEASFADEIEELYHGLKRYVKTRGIKTTMLNAEVPDPTGALNGTLNLIAGTTGIPSRILMGSERGELASSQDTRNFDGRIRERQGSFVEPSIIRPFVDLNVSIGILPEPKDGEYTVEWPDPSTLTRGEEADVSARVAQGVANIAKAISTGNSPMNKSEFREKYLNLSPEQEDEEFVPAKGPGNEEKEEENENISEPEETDEE